MIAIRNLASHKNRLIMLSVILGAGILLTVLIVGNRPGEKSTSVTVTELLANPVYSKYKFGEGERIVDIGIQPLWIPTNIIAETMKHDRVLKKALSDLDMEIRFHSFLKGADVNAFLEKGDLECGMGGDMPTLSIVANADAVVTSLIQYGFSSIVSEKHMLLEDLEGMRIGFPFGSNAHYGLLECLNFTGIKETEVKLVPIDVYELPEAMDQGTIDAYIAWEPVPTVATTRFEGQVVIHRCFTSGYLYFSRSFSDRNPDAVFQIVASQVRAMVWLRKSIENMHRAADWAMQAEEAFSGYNMILSPDQYIQIAWDDILGMPVDVAIPDRNLERGSRLPEEFEFLKGLGLIQTNKNWEEMSSNFDHSFLNDVLSGTGKNQLDFFTPELIGGGDDPDE